MRLLPLVVLLLAPVGSTAGSEGAAVGPLLAAELAGGPAGRTLRVDVVLHDEWEPRVEPAGRSAWIRRRQAEVLESLPTDEFILTHRYVNLCGFAGVATRRGIARLRADPRVARVALDAWGKLDLAEGVPLVGASQLHATGLTGAGVNIAVLDSGVDATDPDLSGSIVTEECFCTIFGPGGCCPNSEDRQSGTGSAQDTDGHGTASAGVITADGVVIGPGVAPDAGIVAIKVGTTSGSIALSDVGAALDWLITNHAGLSARVVNMSVSFGSVPFNDPSVCSGANNTAIAIATLHGLGVAVFVSSGNSGWPDGVAFPACVPEAVAVGAVYDADFGSISWGVCSDANATVDTFACFTNSGDLLDILAPAWQTSTVGRPDFGGTSAASPYAAGEAALLLEADPQLTPDQIRSLLKEHGPLVQNPATGAFYRRSDVEAALTSRLVPIPLLPPGATVALAVILAGLVAWTPRRARRGRASLAPARGAGHEA